MSEVERGVEFVRGRATPRSRARRQGCEFEGCEVEGGEVERLLLRDAAVQDVVKSERRVLIPEREQRGKRRRDPW